MLSSEVLEIRAKKIKAFVFDMDGVITDGTAYCMENGENVRGIYSKDAYILQLAVKLGFNIAILSGGNSSGMEKRFKNLGITDIFMRAHYKLNYLENYIIQKKLTKEEVLYMGDDLPDYEIMKSVGLSIAPSDACDDILAIADYITSKPGGRGAVREAVEKIIRLQSLWNGSILYSW